MFEVRTLHNGIPGAKRALSDALDQVVGGAAYHAQALWTGDVRVSPGFGNYDARAGGEPGHYRENIFAERAEEPEGGATVEFQVSTPVWYALYNEYGSWSIDAKPSARMAADGAEDYLNQALPYLESEIGRGAG